MADGEIKEGATELRLTTSLYRRSDVGSRVVVTGAGVKGGDLSATIVRLLGPREAQLSDFARISVTSAPVTIGTDDSLAFRAAATMSRIIVPRGTYVVDSDISLPTGTVVVCEAGAVILKGRRETGVHAVFRLEGVSGVSIDGCTIIGTNFKARFDNIFQWNFGVGLFGSDDNMITNNTIDAMWGHSAVYLGYLPSAETVGADRNQVVENHLQRCAGYGVSLVSGNENEILRNNLMDCTLGLEPDNEFMPARGNHFSENTMDANLRFGDDVVLACATLSGSEFQGDTTCEHNVLRGVAARVGGEGTLFRDNHFEAFAGTSAASQVLLVEGAIGGEVSGNHVDCSTWCALSDDMACVRYLNNGEHLFAENDVRSAPCSDGIRARDNANVEFRANTVHDHWGSGLRFALTNSDVRIIGNRIAGNNMSASPFRAGIALLGNLEDGGTTGALISGNDVSTDHDMCSLRLVFTTDVTLTNDNVWSTPVGVCQENTINTIQL